LKGENLMKTTVKLLPILLTSSVAFAQSYTSFELSPSVKDMKTHETVSRNFSASIGTHLGNFQPDIKLNVTHNV